MKCLNCLCPQFRDERLVAQLLPLHTYLCSVPTDGMVSPEAIKIQGDIVDILLAYTKAVVSQADSEGRLTRVVPYEWNGITRGY